MLFTILFLFFFFFNDTATTEIYTLSLHDALPIFGKNHTFGPGIELWHVQDFRSEEHTSELQSPGDLVCRLLLEKKKIEKKKKDGKGEKCVEEADCIGLRKK